MDTLAPPRIAAHHTRAKGVGVASNSSPALDVLLSDIAAVLPEDSQALSTARAHSFFVIAPERSTFRHDTTFPGPPKPKVIFNLG